MRTSRRHFRDSVSNWPRFVHLQYGYVFVKNTLLFGSRLPLRREADHHKGVDGHIAGSRFV